GVLQIRRWPWVLGTDCFIPCNSLRLNVICAGFVHRQHSLVLSKQRIASGEWVGVSNASGGIDRFYLFFVSKRRRLGFLWFFLRIFRTLPCTDFIHLF